MNKHPDWIWYGEDGTGKVHVSFGRWQKHECQKRYKIAEIQATEHDHPKRPQGAWRFWYAEDEAVFDYIVGKEKHISISIQASDDNESLGIGYALLKGDKFVPGSADPLKEPEKFGKEISDHVAGLDNKD